MDTFDLIGPHLSSVSYQGVTYRVRAAAYVWAACAVAARCKPLARCARAHGPRQALFSSLPFRPSARSMPALHASGSIAARLPSAWRTRRDLSLWPSAA
jgi:hypothetical protein